MLALATGWTPDVLAGLPARFRAACHWAMFARTVVGPDGIPSIGPARHGMSPEQMMARAKMAGDQVRLRRDLGLID